MMESRHGNGLAKTNDEYRFIGSAVVTMKTLADYWPQLRRDAEQLATPLFPAATPGRPGHCTAPDAGRYQPVGTDDEALCRITDQAHVVDTDGRLWLVVELTPPLHDFLLTRGADAVDDEDDGEAEPGG